MHDYGHHHNHEHQNCKHEELAAICGHNCETCTGDPKLEAKALTDYMLRHNRAHCRELEQLARQLKQMGNDLGYEQIMLAVSDFEKGNLRLATVLAAMGE